MSRENCQPFANDILEWIFFDEVYCFMVVILLQIVSYLKFGDNSELVQIIARHWACEKKNIIQTNDSLDCWHLYASLSLDKLILCLPELSTLQNNEAG